MRTTFNSLFFLKKRRTDDTVGIITVRITVNGRRAEFSTGRKCLYNNWDAAGQKLKGRTPEMQYFNTYLKTVQAKIHEAHRQLMANGEHITADAIKNQYQGKGVQSRMVLEVFAEHNKRMETLVGTQYAKGTLKRFETTYSHLSKFIKSKYKKNDVPVRSVDHAFLADWDFYFRTVGKCGNNTTAKYLSNFKKIIIICVKNGWIDRSPFANFTSKLTEVTRVFLTEEEINRLVTKKFVSERLEIVRDMFVFSCYTGLAYVDLSDLDQSNLHLMMNGEKWIITQRRKTNTSCRIPILPQVEELILKYENHPKVLNSGKLLPTLSNQKTNSYLKEIAAVCDIEKELTFHIARHTFATTVTLTNGVSIESVSKMLGHKNLQTTQHYAKIVDRKIQEDMQGLKLRMSMKKNQDDSTKNTG